MAPVIPRVVLRPIDDDTPAFSAALDDVDVARWRLQRLVPQAALAERDDDRAAIATMIVEWMKTLRSAQSRAIALASK